MEEIMYFVGLWEGDGYRWTGSIGITNSKDIQLLKKLNIKSKLRPYKNRNAFDLEISSKDFKNLINLMKDYSIKLSSRER